MKGRWIVVADSSRARVFIAESPDGKLQEIETMAHPEGRLHEQALTSDLPGHAMDRSTGGRHAMEESTSPKVQEEIYFSKFVADRLNKAQKTGAMASLFIIAPPKMLGLLRENLDKETRALVICELDKNLAQHSPQDILNHLPLPFSQIHA